MTAADPEPSRAVTLRTRGAAWPRNLSNLSGHADRGAFRTGYEASTLRGLLGLPRRPASGELRGRASPGKMPGPAGEPAVILAAGEILIRHH
jgi:hypothetical protein